MADNRIPRDSQTREQSARPTAWKRPGILPDPVKMDGYDYRWVRVSITGNADARNISSRLGEGWTAVPIEEQPQMKFFLDPNSRFKDNIEIGGLLLCKMPSELNVQRNQYYANMNKQQSEAVDNNFMRQSDARMPLFSEKKSTTTRGFGKGS